MSPIMELIKAAELFTWQRERVKGKSQWNLAAAPARKLSDTLPELKRLVDWVKAEQHGPMCLIGKSTKTTYGVMAGGHSLDIVSKHDGSCTCGLSEIQSLIGE